MNFTSLTSDIDNIVCVLKQPISFKNFASRNLPRKRNSRSWSARSIEVIELA